MSLALQARTYTVADYMNWSDDERWELIDGVPYNMTPAPNLEHQDIAGGVYSLLRTALKGKTCKPFISPTDVVLSDFDVVQPDVLVVCDPNKQAGKNIQGAPDFIAEILSPSTGAKDRRQKRALYERAGVSEYLIIDAANQTAERYTLADGRYGASEVFDLSEAIKLKSLEGVDLPMWEIFGVEKPETKPAKEPQ